MKKAKPADLMFHIYDCGFIHQHCRTRWESGFFCNRPSVSKFMPLDANREKANSDQLILAGIEAPEPVYFCSIEPPYSRDQNKLEEALKQLVREDPSLRVYYDQQSQQTILEGMGELHIEIIKDRLLREWNLDVFLGPLEINYRESVQGYGEHFFSMEETISDHKQHIGLRLSVQGLEGAGKLKDIEFLHTKGETSLANLRKDWISAIKEGCRNACTQGPLLGYPVEDIRVTLHSVEATRGVSLPLISACARQCLVKAMAEATTSLLEPVMYLEICIFGAADSTSDVGVQGVLADLSKRRAEICDVAASVEQPSASQQAASETKTVVALAPLAELRGLASSMRTVTSGRGTLHMELHGYRRVTEDEQQKVLEKITGIR